MNIYNIILFIILIIFIITYFYYYLCNFVNKEGIIFTNPELIKKYPEYGIKINTENKTLEKNNKILSYKHLNSENGLKNSINKYITYKKLKNNNIPIPNFYLYDKSKDINFNVDKIIHLLNYPLVVKPTNGTFGNNVKSNINDKKSLIEHIKFLLKNRKDDILIEEHHIGKEYRIMVIKNKIVDVVQRDKPFVIGDGKSDLKKLIKEHKHNDHKIHNIDENLIKQQNYTLNSVVPDKKKVYVSNVNNYHNGGSIKQISLDSIHPINIVLFSRINKILDMNVNGIDFISKDISKPYYNTGVIIECNGGPDFDIHYKAAKDKNKLLNRFMSLLQELF